MDQESVNVFYEDKKFIVATLALVSLMSLIGSSLILFTYTTFKKNRNYAYKLVTYLSIANAILSIGNIFSLSTMKNEDESGLCHIQAFFVNFGGLSSILWTSIIAWSIFSATVLSAKNLREKNMRFVLCGFGIPLVLSLIPFFTNQYGRAGYYCWIKEDPTTKDTVMRFGQFYIPLWIALVFNVYAYIKVIRFIKKYISTTLEIRFIHRLKYYPLVLVFCWIFATINRIYSIFGQEVVALAFLHVVFGALQGFLNAVVYGTTDQIKQLWKNKLCCCFSKVYFAMKDDTSASKKEEEMKQNQENGDNDESQPQQRDVHEASVEIAHSRDHSESQQKFGLNGHKLEIRV